jgi:hypothetical protein
MNQGGKSLLSWKTITTDSTQGYGGVQFSLHISAQQLFSAPRVIFFFIALQANAQINNQKKLDDISAGRVKAGYKMLLPNK